MTSNIRTCFERLEQSVLENGAMIGYSVSRLETAATEGMMRVRVQLKDGGELELFEYVVLDSHGRINRLKYSYHWQDAKGGLVRRWDAVNHYPELPYTPHYVHLADGSVEGMNAPPKITTVLNEIEASLERSH